MKIYRGRRTIDGIQVEVGGGPLMQHDEIKRFSPHGFEWAYEGAEPRQLALAILIDHLNDAQQAIAMSEPFMKAVIANLDNDWVLTSDEIDLTLRAIELGRH